MFVPCADVCVCCVCVVRVCVLCVCRVSMCVSVCMCVLCVHVNIIPTGKHQTDSPCRIVVILDEVIYFDTSQTLGPP